MASFDSSVAADTRRHKKPPTGPAALHKHNNCPNASNCIPGDNGFCGLLVDAS